MIKRKNKRWTFNAVTAKAKEYSCRNTFKQHANTAYQAAIRNGWLDLVCAHMTLNKKPNHWWTKERCIEAVKQFTSRTSFMKGCRGGYAAAVRNGWIDDVLSNIRLGRKPANYWTFDRCKEEALKYPDRKTFQKESSSAYTAAWRNDWLENGITDHMPPLRRQSKNGYWTLNRVAKVAAKYQTRSSFAKGDSAAYKAAQTRKWLDEVCSHMQDKCVLPPRERHQRQLERESAKPTMVFKSSGTANVSLPVGENAMTLNSVFR